MDPLERTIPTAEELFLAAIERPGGERSAFLDSACRGDSTLRAEVELLVACHDGAGEFMEHPPSGMAGVVDDLDLAKLPERIGKFRIKRLLGAGGMGCVYLAETAEPRREVALKVVRPGYGVREIVRRFRHEVQAIGGLQHPGIAALYEAGAEATPGGPLPYFAMEYVQGASITGHARERGLSWRERMGLMARVAHAVQHAHQRGVIHRDLKPANILVDASGEPKVLDFGVARLIGSEGGGGEGGGAGVGRTMTGQVVGTLSYMSPEQLSGDPRRVDARTDIYSLGVILYELLAGEAPYDVGSGSLGEAVRTLEAFTPRRLGEFDRQLAGDADVIVRKAMAKEPGERYQSAAELAADLERCVLDLPIAARGPGLGYQLKKFAKRHRLLVGMAGAGVMALAGGLALFLWQAGETERARAEAVEQLGLANASNEFIEKLFEAPAPENARKADLLVRDVLKRSTVESIAAQYPEQQRLRMRLNGIIGRTYKELSLLAESEPHLVEAARIARQHVREGSPEWLKALQDLGHLYKLEDRFREGEPILRETTEVAERVLGVDSHEAIGCRNDLASLLLRRGEAAEAERLFAQSVEGARRTLPPGDNMTLATLNNLAAAKRAQGKIDEAIAIRRGLVEECIKSLGEESLGTITAMNNAGKDLLDTGKAAEAEPMLRRALELRIKIQGVEHRSTLNTRCNLGACLAALGRVEEARRELAAVVAQADATIPAGSIDAAKYDHEYGLVLARAGALDEATTRLERAYGAYAALLGATNKRATDVARELSALWARAENPEAARRWEEKSVNP